MDAPGIIKNGKDDSSVGDTWTCMTCFRQWPEQSSFLTHGRSRTHPLAWNSKDDAFYCVHCNRNIDESMINEKQKSSFEECRAAIRTLITKEVPFEKKDLAITANDIKGDQNGHEDYSKECKLTKPFGLNNLGNTCFMNSALQALASVVHFTTGLETSFSNNVTSSVFPISFALRDLLVTLLSKNDNSSSTDTCKRSSRRSYGNAINPSFFFEKLSEKYDFLGRYDQQDSHDFVRLLFNAIDDEYEDAKKKALVDWVCSPHSGAFGSIMAVRVDCHRCKVRSTKKEPSLDLSLAISISTIDEVAALSDDLEKLEISQKKATTNSKGKTPSINDLIQNWMRPQKLDGENKFACEHCYKKFPSEDEDTASKTSKVIYSPATCRYAISDLPKCLLIHLQRFSIQKAALTRRRNRMTYGKDHSPVKLSKSITLNEVEYVLRSFVIHEGSSAESGHYVAIINRNGSWFFVSDSSVSQIEEETALSYENAYMIFYECL